MTAAPLPVRDRPGTASRRPEPSLRLVTAAGARPARTPFVLLVGALLAAGLLGLLLLNTAIASDAFRLNELQRRSVALADRQQQLEQALAAAQSPALLAARAGSLGMVPGSAGDYVRLANGRVVAAVSAAPRPAPPPGSPPTAVVKPGPPASPRAGVGAAKPATPAVTAAATVPPPAPARATPTPTPTTGRR